MKLHKPPFKLRELKIEVTHRCPLACAHCSSDATPSSSREMLREDCLSILNQAISIGVRKVAFSGGEPLLWEHLRSMVELASSARLHVTLYTSGNVDHIEPMMIGLAKSGLNTVVFSIFGADQQSHERLTRGAGSFQKTLQAIEAAGKAGLERELHFVPLSNNFMMLTDIAELSKSLNIPKISVLRFVPQGRGHLIAGRTLSRLQNVQLRRTILALRNKGYDIRTGSPYNFLMLNSQPACCSAIDRLIIGPDLRIYPCDAFKQIAPEEVVGAKTLDTLANDTLEECWENAPYLQAVRKYLTTAFTDPCKSCNELELCLSGCLAQKVLLEGNLDKRKDPACLLQGARL